MDAAYRLPIFHLKRLGFFCTKTMAMGPKPKPPEERFWPKVNKDGPISKYCPELGACWLWTGFVRSNGHASFRVPGVGTSAYQFSWFIHNGPIPAGLSVCHFCNDGRCVNPLHLVLGTQSDNMKYAKETGRTTQGEKGWNAVFTEDQVREIRNLYSQGVRVSELMTRFNKGRSAISHVVHGDRWTHLAHSTPPDKRRQGEKHYLAKVTEDDVREIRRLKAETNMSFKAIAAQFGLTPMGAAAIVYRWSWKHVD